MKKYLVLIIILVFSGIILSACEETEKDVSVKEKPVKAMLIQEQEREVILNYKGRVLPSPVESKTLISSGLTSKDVKEVETGGKAYIFADDKTYEAKIIEIVPFPDQSTATFDVRTMLDEDLKYNIGDIVDIGFVKSKDKGIWLKLQYILSDGFDFVYVIKDDRAYKKSVEIKSIFGNDALVEGLEVGDMLITSGYSKLSDGYRVKPVEDEEDIDGEDRDE